MKKYKSIKVNEATYNNLLLLQYLLFKKQKITINKTSLLAFLIVKFKKSLEMADNETKNI